MEGKKFVKTTLLDPVVTITKYQLNKTSESNCVNTIRKAMKEIFFGLGKT